MYTGHTGHLLNKEWFTNIDHQIPIAYLLCPGMQIRGPQVVPEPEVGNHCHSYHPVYRVLVKCYYGMCGCV